MRYTYLIILFALIATGCGVDKNRFAVEGRLLNLNQGEFYIYNADGMIQGIDTIRVQGGRFQYEMECKEAGTLILVFPNFSSQPIFAQPGKKVSIDGDASHIKKMEIKGTDDNDLMTAFRLQVAEISPPEITKTAEQFILDHPQSQVALYLVRKYFIDISHARYSKAISLLNKIQKAQPDNVLVQQLKNRLLPLQKNEIGSKLPTFSAVTMQGKAVKSSDYTNGLAIFLVWSPDVYASVDQLRQINSWLGGQTDRVKLLTLCVTGDKKVCREVQDREGWTMPTICDEALFDGNVIRNWACFDIPDNIVVYNGKIVARHLSTDNLKNELKKRGINIDRTNP